MGNENFKEQVAILLWFLGYDATTYQGRDGSACGAMLSLYETAKDGDEIDYLEEASTILGAVLKLHARREEIGPAAPSEDGSGGLAWRPTLVEQVEAWEWWSRLPLVDRAMSQDGEPHTVMVRARKFQGKTRSLAVLKAWKELKDGA